MTGVIILILLGILLFLIEFLIVPGVTVAGIGGIILMGSGIYLAFENFGNQTGFIILLIALFSSVAILVLALRARTWKGVMLNTNIDGRVNVGPEKDTIKPGDKGICLTRLAPVGKVKVNNIVIEGKSIAGFLDAKTEIEVVKIVGFQAIVKPIKS